MLKSNFEGDSVRIKRAEVVKYDIFSLMTFYMHAPNNIRYLNENGLCIFHVLVFQTFRRWCMIKCWYFIFVGIPELKKLIQDVNKRETIWGIPWTKLFATDSKRS